MILKSYGERTVFMNVQVILSVAQRATLDKYYHIFYSNFLLTFHSIQSSVRAGPSKVISSPKDILFNWCWLMGHTNWQYVKFSLFIICLHQNTFVLVHYILYNCQFTSQRETDYQQHVSSCISSYYGDWCSLQLSLYLSYFASYGGCEINFCFGMIWTALERIIYFTPIKTIWNRNWMILQIAAMQVWSYVLDWKFGPPVSASF